eukprot:NODE_1702_length_1326_cov_11.861394_g1415_i0.p3 GENE.NODE_1702_length_1326_cov_11.861394_g1415_i0~~NODE_1702_length_1326_cov_11.861394_g1415_i0.p3  ORF type:complete len:134 (+),score=20.29 NODE_1702_length_1326_cov_11.861394_g1415_i0:695-1096(+)
MQLCSRFNCCSSVVSRSQQQDTTNSMEKVSSGHGQQEQQGSQLWYLPTTDSKSNKAVSSGTFRRRTARATRQPALVSLLEWLLLCFFHPLPSRYLPTPDSKSNKAASSGLPSVPSGVAPAVLLPPSALQVPGP